METIQLEYPVEIGGVQVQQLKMRRPKVRDQIGADKGSGSPAEKEVRLFANLCEQAPAVIEDLDMLDYQKLQETYTSFLSRAKKPSAGGSSSSPPIPAGG